MARKTSKAVGAGAKKNSRVFESFRLIFSNWKIFLPLLIVSWTIGLLVVGASEDTMITFAVLMYILLWLSTLFVMRQIYAGGKVTFFDAIYNAPTPLVSTLLVFLVILVECVPVMLVLIGQAAAIETELFNNAVYGFLFVLFAIVMILLSVWLVSGNIMALIAVTTPGTRPSEALKLTREVARGRRGEMFVMMVVLAVIVFVFLGVGALAGLLVSNIVQRNVIQGGVYAFGSFAVIYAATYLYVRYRELIKMEKK